MLYRLKNSGFQAHLVGGGVRDLLLGREPKDFDIATDARPEQVKRVFRNCRLIGRRFRLAHVHFGREIIEVATFRGAQNLEDSGDREIENGMLLRDNVYGNIEEDALRRDFTINALYYNIKDFSVIDYVGGLEMGAVPVVSAAAALSHARGEPVRAFFVRKAAKGHGAKQQLEGLADDESLEGKKAVIVGSNNSAHDIAADLYEHGTLPMGDGTQSPDDFVHQQSASTGLPEHMCRANMQKNAFVLSNMEQIIDALHGQGTGKTKLAETLAHLYGGEDLEQS